MIRLRFSRLIRRRVARVLAAAAATAAVGLYVGNGLVEEQSARVTVRLLPLPGTAFSQRDGNIDVELRTDAQLARSDQVLSRVLPRAGPDATIEQIRSRLRIRVLPSTEIVQLTYHAATRRQAIRVAGLVAESLLEVRTAQSARLLSRQAELLEGQLDVTAGLLGEAVQPGNRAEVLPLLVARTTHLEKLLIGTGGGSEAGYVVGMSSSVELAERLERAGAAALAGGTSALVVLVALGSASRRMDP